MRISDSETHTGVSDFLCEPDAGFTLLEGGEAGRFEET